MALIYDIIAFDNLTGRITVDFKDDSFSFLHTEILNLPIDNNNEYPDDILLNLFILRHTPLDLHARMNQLRNPPDDKKIKDKVKPRIP